MPDYFEIDFLKIDSNKSGDAIAVRYEKGNLTWIHVIDGGYQDTGKQLVQHINEFYNNPGYIDYVVASHPDGDHAGGLRTVLDTFQVGQLWMLRPWLYADELIYRFSRFKSVDNLIKRLKEIYPNIAALEEIAEKNGITIYEPFQGARIGEFVVLAPTKSRYLDLVVESDKTPESLKEAEPSIQRSFGLLLEKAVTLFRALWGEESFSSEETSPENNMSVIQYANLCNEKILLTADAGRDALWEAIEYAPYAGLPLPGINRFQVPHHGSRRNVSTEVLDSLFGERLTSKPNNGDGTFTAIVSAAERDEHHPKKAVIRALIHRGANVYTTEKDNLRSGHNAPDREGWSTATPVEYPEQQEE